MQATPGTLDISDDPTPWLLVQPNAVKKYCVLWLQGWNSTIAKHSERIQRLADQTGISFAMIDYAGHGTHPVPREKTTREQQFNEVLAAYDALKSQGYENIIVAGTSFGGYMSALLAAQRNPYAVILRAPAIYKDDEFAVPQAERHGYLDDAYQKFKHTVTSTGDLAALRGIKKFSKAVYVIEHEHDSVIPKNIPQAYFQAAQRGNYLVVPKTEHSPAMAPGADARFTYIEQLIASIIRAIILEETLTEN